MNKETYKDVYTYTADDEEPNCIRCDHCCDDYNLYCNKCGPENFWSWYERAINPEYDDCSIDIVVDKDFDPYYYRESNEVNIEFQGFDDFSNEVYSVTGSRFEVESFLQEANHHIIKM